MTNSKKYNKLIKTLTIIVLFILTIGSIIYYVFWLLFYTQAVQGEPSRAIAEAINNGLSDVRFRTKLDVPRPLVGVPAPPYCNLKADGALSYAPNSICRVVTASSSTKHCHLWWLGKVCAVITIDKKYTKNNNIIKNINMLIKNRCEYLPSPNFLKSQPTLNSKNIDQYKNFWNQAGCQAGADSPAVVVLVMSDGKIANQLDL